MLLSNKKRLATVLFGVAWIVTVALGLRALLNYESKPGSIGSVPGKWPTASHVPRASDRLTLVMCAHPHCPCTRASVGELAEIMARVHEKLTAYVLFYKPKGSGADWDDTGLRRSAANIPGVKVLSDVDGLEAQKLGAETSGHTFLFGSDGRLLFSGGITQSRGHAGGNAGESAILAIANNQRADQSSTFVFGCAIQKPSRFADKTSCSK
jgi:hypothetical protein